MSLASKLIERGIEKLDVSMLPADYRKQILTEVAELLFNQGRLEDCALTIAKSGNMEKQAEFGLKFLQEGRPVFAVEALLNSGADDLLKRAGVACMLENNKAAALKAFSSLNDKEMEEFIKQNL